ncbi:MULTISPECIES: tRNA (adenosine(37)-N6)-threonylcarbamoyltransferase complex dimerization subunit type 1 TsaB [unclassified Mesotoga]|jgi:tRNA threonylcarbamoyl adenosine modification protein YeaZ|uniref:tRNA (adenosine(37)-N6)-threonylcarbamoyltransferase complex dimerization subunit type 1 TsaB n=1 Tax=unclassified Mesotoga TaxID=1184398 RepID=UPI000EF1890F|nr:MULTISPECIES: tRNA (adenosine(37)-N6)-threonylcarbamoyltransferase complex dimerization subunit type 1 TsaB [unclassified Mesotoga]MDI9369290.1 tRNA (adenosine(37)-N6)-threonylcarbamoyltransferase complex dimerization subunit type 1 TsaB [Thermotogota bacterium]MDD3680264.1 tRNA (adenosine(37)-N6)-threonylcarbamoyltransferase complex dimerization subunit type 1 TsaB [Mesotoga sp.]MDD4206805.1 tRNA (adenosine(37)-N6)-threonylcarbamoyltransferase complex dimerization subunit type 1 TsaB [Mesoto
MRYICFDTSSRTLLLSVSNGRAVIDIKAQEVDRYGSMLAVIIKQSIDNLNLKASELDFIGVGVGPGSLTGLRVGISTAKGMAFPFDLPTVQFNSLDILARPIDSERFVVLRRGREGHYYWREYRKGIPFGATSFTSTAELVSRIDASEIELFLDGDMDPEFDGFRISHVERCDPSVMRDVAVEKFSGGDTIKYSSLEPIYLQKSIAEINWEKKSEG